MSIAIRRKALSFDEYWLASQAWERRGIALGTARALVNAGFLTVDDLRAAPDLELAAIPRVGAKSLAILFGLMGREMPTVPKNRGDWRRANRAVGTLNVLSQPDR